jgi:hypothetical protein
MTDHITSTSTLADKPAHHHAAPHCHFSYRLPSGYRSFAWWPTAGDALGAAAVHDSAAAAELISQHTPGCACPTEENAA